MSYGLVVCSKCMREVHQQSSRFWYHCEDGLQMCYGADAIYPKDKSEIKGKYCGKNDIGDPFHWKWNDLY